ncbi:unnamed protein product [Rangifer tarandus platyrhynchus]|uniref:Uncharacterized protein n=2 Tax=Rangifer tarandus platyrhynchus TaxID=3082113 RepID=A0ABN8Z0L4_RANTA|nr:unnamed protein product [Rangifer tarandus platyrhynchus]CAI9694195.1 unnamed protein product [Rangifer tarandus platyrhynchus]
MGWQERGDGGEAMQQYRSRAQLRRPPRLGWRCVLSPPPPPACDKRRRECAEPTFTTAGTSKASLLNPVSNGYQHRASNVIRPAAAATSLRGEPVRARARPAAAAPGAGKAQASGAGLPFPRAIPGA